MIAYQQDGWNPCLGEAHDPVPPFPLKSRGRVSIFVSIPGKEHTIHFFLDGAVNDLIQGSQEIEDAQRQTGFGISAAVIGYVDMRVSEVKYFRHRNY